MISLPLSASFDDLAAAFDNLIHLAVMLEVDGSEVELDDVFDQAEEICLCLARGGLALTPTADDTAILRDLCNDNPGGATSRKVRELLNRVGYGQRPD